MILIALLSFLVSVHAGVGVEAEDLDLRVMSFNVRWDGLDNGKNAWSNREPVAIEMIERYAPDVIGLQEPSLAQTRQLDEGLENYASFQGENKRDEHITFLYRSDRFVLAEGGSFWLVEHSDLSGGTRRCVWVRLTEKNTNRSFYMFNNHFDHRSSNSRQQSAVSLVRGIRNRKYDDPFVVVGDFNETEDGSAMTYLKNTAAKDAEDERSVAPDSVLIDTFRTRYPAQRDAASGHGFSGSTKGPRIDFIFVRRQDEIIDAQIIHHNQNGVYPSDHFPVTARVRLVDGLSRLTVPRP